MTKSTTMDGGQRFVRSEPTKRRADLELEPLYDLLGRVIAKVKDEFADELDKRDAKIATLQANIAERDAKHDDKLMELKAQHIKQIKQLTARSRELERKMTTLKEKVSPPTIIAWKTDKAHFRLTPYMSDGRPGPAAPLHGLFRSCHELANSE
jgi:DNA repair exonuclease SbcCD ATPase subunit